MLRNARRRQGLSAERIEQRVGSSHGYITQIERAERCPSRVMAAALTLAIDLLPRERAVLWEAALPGVGRDHALRRRRW